jgi:hypothetical protein
MGTDKLSEINKSLKEKNKIEAITFWTLAKEVLAFSLIAEEVPLLFSIDFKNVSVGDINGDSFVVYGETEWDYSYNKENIPFEATINSIKSDESDSEDIAGVFLLKFPKKIIFSILNDKIKLQNFAFMLEAQPPRYMRYEEPWKVSGGMQCVFKINSTDIKIKAEISDASTLYLEADFEAITLPSINDVLSLFSDGNGESYIKLPDGLNELILYDFALEFDLEKKSVNSIRIDVGSAEKDSKNYTQWKIIEDILSFDSYRINLEVDNPLDSESRSIGGGIKAELSVGNIPIDIYASYPATSGWKFEGWTEVGENVDAGDFMGDIVQKFGVKLPNALTSLKLKDIYMSFEKGEDEKIDFRYKCTCDFAICDTYIEIITDIHLWEANGKDNGNSSYSKEVSGILTISPETDTVKTKEFEFDIKFISTDEKEAVSFSWEEKDGSGPFDIKHLVGLLNPEDKFEIPDGLNFGLKSVIFEYDIKNKSIFLAAVSNDYGYVFFISTLVEKGEESTVEYKGEENVEGKERALIFGVGMEASIKLAKVPFIGEQLKDLGEIRFKQARFMLSTKDLKEYSVPELPKIGNDNTDIREKLGLKEKINIEKGIAISGTLDIEHAQFSKDFKLDIPFKKEEQKKLLAPATRDGAITLQEIEHFSDSPDDTNTSSDSVSWINIQKTIGPVMLKRIGGQYKEKELTIFLDGSLVFSALELNLEGMSITSPLTEFKPTFHLSGIGVSYAKDPVNISGAFVNVPKDNGYQYEGGLIVITKDTSFGAVGSYAKVNGQTSMFVFAKLDLPLGGPPYLYFMGLCGGFGINRKLRIPNHDEVYKFPFVSGMSANKEDESANKVLEELENDKFPFVSGMSAGTANDVLDKLEKDNWLTIEPGNLWLAAGVHFGSCKIIEANATVIAEFGHELAFALLGIGVISLPRDSEKKFVHIELALEAMIKPVEGIVAFCADITQNSYLLYKECHLTGGFAFYTWFAPNDHAGDFVITMGGYHPKFKIPEHYPKADLIGINWQVSDKVLIKGGGFFALTPSCVMGGGALEIVFHDADLRAWFTAHAYFYMAWEPFHYDVSIGSIIGVSYKLNCLSYTKTINAELGVTLDMWGPTTSGVAHVNWHIISFSVKFGKGDKKDKPVPIGWDDFKTKLLPTEEVNVNNTSKKMVKNKITASSGVMKIDQDTGAWHVRLDEFAFSTESPIPVRSLNPEVSQLKESNSEAPIYIRPMEKEVSSSEHILSITKAGNLNESIELSNSEWLLEANKTKLPNALWSAQGDEDDAPTTEHIVGFKVSYIGIDISNIPTSGPIDMVNNLSYDNVYDDKEQPALPSGSDSIFKPQENNESVNIIASNIVDKKTKDKRTKILNALTDVYEMKDIAESNIDMDKFATSVYTRFQDDPLIISAND